MTPETASVAILTVAAALTLGGPAAATDLCQGFGPQTPRDISDHTGTNTDAFALAPAATAMNLCDIHFHTQAEHKGPGFSTFAGSDDHGGYRCNGSATLTEAEMTEAHGEHGGCGHLHAGDTVEVHWVYTSCNVAPGPGLASCLPDGCDNPTLRVESQVFLAVNDQNALDFRAFTYAGAGHGLHQPKSLPSGTGDPVVFRGSTTGPSYTQETCSPYEVTWSVRPNCAKVNVASLHHWCDANPFAENHAHGVRQLVTAPELLAHID